MRFCLYIEGLKVNLKNIVTYFHILRFLPRMFCQRSVHIEKIFSLWNIYIFFKGKVILIDRCHADSCVVTTVAAQESARNLSIKMTLVKGRFSGFLIEISWKHKGMKAILFQNGFHPAMSCELLGSVIMINTLSCYYN